MTDLFIKRGGSIKFLSFIKRYRSVLLGGLLCMAGGFLNGLLGSGGGIVFMYCAQFFLIGDGELSEGDRFANVIALTLPVCALSLFLYALRGNVNFSLLSVFILPALLGGGAGAYLGGRLKPSLLRLLFAVLVIWSGIRFL